MQAGVSCTVQVKMIRKICTYMFICACIYNILCAKNGNAKTYTSCNTHQRDATEVDVMCTESTDAELNEGVLLVTGH